MSDSDYEPEYEPETVSVLTNPALEVTVMTLVPPPLEYMSQLHSAKQEVSSRFIWTGSLMLARYLLSDPTGLSELKDSTILELGAGTGLVGLCVAMSSAPFAVCMTDGDEEALKLLRENAGKNGVSIVPGATAGVPPRYLWGDDEEGGELRRCPYVHP